MAQSIRRLEQLMRNQGGSIPLWTNVADWTDSIVLVANAAQSYTLKSDAASKQGTKLRINASVGPVYMNSFTTATVPAATTTTGASSIMIIPQAAGGTAYIVFPVEDGGILSFICAAASVLTIEAFD